MGYSIDDRRYWDRQKAEMAAEREARREYPETEGQELYRELTKLNAMTAEYFTAEQIAAQRAVVDTLEAQIAAATETEWSREVTIERRAAWNAAVQDPSYRAKNGKTVLVGKIEADLGFGLDELKAQVKRWAL